MSNGLPCCCNQVGPSVLCVCGTWTIPPVNPDQGQCGPFRVKLSCEVSPLPVIQCADDTYTTIYQPENEDFPFKVSAKLFDQNCEDITDQLGNPILTFIT